MRISRAWAAILILGAAAAAPAAAQQVLYIEGFDAPAQGWRLSGLWAMDGSPSTMTGGAAHTGSGSLNFNNGTDYRGISRGWAVSPSIAVQGSATVRFYCNYRTETTGTAFDRRTVEVRVNGTAVATLPLSSRSTAAAPARCAAMGTWHRHDVAVPVPGGAASASVEILFGFDSVDGYSNAFPGWFIDDVLVETAAVDAFRTLARTTLDFRQLSTRTSIRPDRGVEISRSSPTARYALVTGRATDAEWQALIQTLGAANLATIPSTIPDPNVYVVAPTTFVLEVTSAIPANQNTISGSLGVYGQWAARLSPFMQAIEAIEARLLAGGTTGDDHGNNTGSATDLDVTASAPAAGTIDPAGDVDVFRVVDPTPVILIYPPPQKTYTVEATVTGNMDTVLELYAENGTTLLASNDDAPGLGLGSRVTVTTAHGATLYAKVRHYSATGTGAYAIRATGSSVVSGTADDHGNVPAAATPIQTDGSPNAGTIGFAGDVDWFKFTHPGVAIFPPPPVTLTIETTVVGNMDTVIELYADDGTTLLASNDDAPGLGYASKLVYTGTVKTAYFLVVRHYSASGTGSYTVAVTGN